MYTCSEVAFSGLKAKATFRLCSADFTENICHPFAFVCSSTCLTVRTKRIVELMNVLCCYYLPALVWICCCYVFCSVFFFFLGGGEGWNATGGQKPWSQKKKIRRILYTV